MSATTWRDAASAPATATTYVFPHTTSVFPAIDAFIARYAGRELVTGAEVVDLLLDLRLLAEADELVAAS